MPKSSIPYDPSTGSSDYVGEPTARASLFDCKDDFIRRVAPIGMAAIYFGGFTLAPQDAALSRQALYKLSFLHRHFLQPAGLSVMVKRQTAILSGSVKSKHLLTMAEILARQIEGIKLVKDETELPKGKPGELETVREAIQLLFATDSTLRSGLQVTLDNGHLILEGEVTSAAQKNWAEQLVGTLASWIDSRLKISSRSPEPVVAPVDMDDESLQALVLLRLRLVRETEHLPLRVKASRGIVTLQGKVRTEALRQRAENLTRSSLGLRELRSSLSIGA
ncbi:MAG: BON domain-containing protein [Methylacidiphilales bacterium]|nr:BON domain-containing protein [Candidatus Methylacidiphilales bacterium]